MKKTIKWLTAATIVTIVCLALFACTPASTTITHRVEFDYNGVATQTVIDGEKAVEPKIALEDEEIVWCTDEALTQVYDFGESVTTDLKLYANKEKTVFTVSFTGEDITLPAVKVRKGDKLYAPAVTKDGYSAVWKSGDSAYIFGCEVNSDLTLNLTWSANTYKVTFYNYDGEFLAEADVAYGNEINPTQLTPTHAYPDFYSFKGWDKDLSNIDRNLDVYAEYEYCSLPEEIFKFTCLPDGTYGIELKAHAGDESDYSSYNFSGNYGLPDVYKGKPVTKLMNRAMYTFYVNSFVGIDKLFVPSSVKIISAESFYYCRVGELVLGEGVEEIWAAAFTSYGGKKITLPSTINFIEELGLAYCSAEFELVDNDHYINVNNGIYSDDLTTILYVNDSVSEYTIPASVNRIYPNLFAGNTSLKTVTIEGDIDILPPGVFADCTMLNSVTFLGKVKQIWGMNDRYPNMREPKHFDYEIVWGGIIYFRPAFYGNRMLTLDSLPRGVEYIGDFAIEGIILNNLEIGANTRLGEGSFVRTRIKNIIVDETNPYYYTVGDGAALIERGDNGDKFCIYASLNSNTELTMPDSVTEVSRFSFYMTNTLKSFTISSGVTFIPRAFVIECSSISSLTIRSSHLVLEEYINTLSYGCAFTLSPPCFDCGLSNIDWGDCHIERLPYFCLCGTKFDVFTVPKHLVDIEYGAFEQRSSMDPISYAVEEGNTKYIAFDDDLYEIKDNNELTLRAFKVDTRSYSYMPTQEDFGDYTLTEIGDGAFLYNWFIREIVLPEGVRSIGKRAMYTCINIESMTFPSTLNFIGEEAFYYMIGTDLYKQMMDPEGEMFPTWGSKGLKEVIFKGERAPKIIPMTVAGRALFDGEDLMTGEAITLDVKIKVPNDSFEDYVTAFYNYNGTKYAELVDRSDLTVYTYKFETNGGSEVADIIGSTSLYFETMPLTWWRGDGNKFFAGWYTKDGNNGIWGDRVDDLAAYRGNPNEQNEVYLYARWSNRKIEDGSRVCFAYNVGTDVSDFKLINGSGTYWFEFTPHSDGYYRLRFDFGAAIYSETRACVYDREAGTFTNINFTAKGFFMQADTTYYFYSYIDDKIFSEQSNEVIGYLSPDVEFGCYVTYTPRESSTALQNEVVMPEAILTKTKYED